jgi:hypothetical protein
VSSHREAPEVSKDPVADSTDVYAFVSPDHPDTVTLIANYIPLEGPASGPNFYSFGDEVLYEIHVDNNGDAEADVTFQFRFKSELTDPDTFLYNTGPITSLTSANWNSRQTYSVTLVRNGRSSVLAEGLSCPPCNIGPLSTPNYAHLAESATYNVHGSKVFAGQRADGFYVDLGAIFDLGDLRPFENLHYQYGMHLFSKGAVIGVWTTASRQRASVWDGGRRGKVWSGPWDQVSRLGNPLINEVLIPLGQKDYWNTQEPAHDKQFASYVAQPQLAALLPVLYPKVFPKLAKLVASKKPRADLEAILLTGIPSGIVPGFQNYTGPVQADMLRLNTAIPPSRKPNVAGVVGGDLAGYPNGRRVFDDVVAIELRAVAGVTVPLVDPSYKPDGAAGLLTDGTTPPAGYLSGFPYLGVPCSGFSAPA